MKWLSISRSLPLILGLRASSPMSTPGESSKRPLSPRVGSTSSPPRKRADIQDEIKDTHHGDVASETPLEEITTSSESKPGVSTSLHEADGSSRRDGESGRGRGRGRGRGGPSKGREYKGPDRRGLPGSRPEGGKGPVDGAGEVEGEEGEGKARLPKKKCAVLLGYVLLPFPPTIQTR